VVGGDAKQRTSVQFVDDREDCSRKLAALDPAAFPVLIQRRIHGAGEGIFVARWQGRTIARFAHRRLREKPPAGGVSVYRESIAAEPALLTACDSLLDALQWSGVAMIEGKRDAATGRWYVMEINGRFWGSLQLAIDAGVDFPALLSSAVLDGALSEPPAWRAGVRLRWEWGDVDHLLLRMLRSKERLSLPPDSPGRIATLLQWCSVVPGRDKLEVLRLRDPRPFLVETLERLGVVR
jgi:predicted ATP-grasp superfamily ATP-dependent carboligase